MMIAARFIIILSLFGTLSFQALAKPTLEEFREEITDHRERVKTNSILIYNKFSVSHPEFFPHMRSLPDELRNRLMDVYYGIHDAPKTMSIEELKANGYEGDKEILELLHGIWGESVRPWFIDALNKTEEIHKMRTLKKKFPQIDKRLLNLLVREMQYPEFIADNTDTKIMRGPELAFDPQPMDAYRLFKFVYHDVVAATISVWLETQVYKIAPEGANSCYKQFRSKYGKAN